MTLDIWFFTAICLFILAFCAVLRIRHAPIKEDRLLAVNIATTLACAGVLAFTVSVGDLMIPVFAGIIACIIYVIVIWLARGRGEML